MDECKSAIETERKGEGGERKANGFFRSKKKVMLCQNIVCQNMWLNAILLTAKPSNVQVNTGSGVPFATLNKNSKKKNSKFN